MANNDRPSALIKLTPDQKAELVALTMYRLGDTSQAFGNRLGVSAGHVNQWRSRNRRPTYSDCPDTTATLIALYNQHGWPGEPRAEIDKDHAK